MRNRIISLLLILSAGLSSCDCTKQVNKCEFKEIAGWSQEVNARLKHFLDSTAQLDIRKVAVFDGDGTVIGQAPHYLADEALYKYADQHLVGKTDSVSLAKLAIINGMIEHGNNVSKRYCEDRVHFLSGMTTEEVLNLGNECFQTQYKDKFYPQMLTFIENLKSYGYEVYILTASPELLYQKFLCEQLGIPEVNVIGVKSIIENDIVTSKIIMPIPQDDGKAAVIPTFIKAKPLIVGGNSRGDMDMMNESVGLKLIVNPDDITVRPESDGAMAGLTVKQYWEKEGAVIVRCNDVRNTEQEFYTHKWGMRENIAHEVK